MLSGGNDEHNNENEKSKDESISRYENLVFFVWSIPKYQWYDDLLWKLILRKEGSNKTPV